MNIHTCSYECERPECIKAQRDELAQRMFKLVAEAVAAEREACAEICDNWELGRDDICLVAAEIRARGET